jgi:membrane protein
MQPAPRPYERASLLATLRRQPVVDLTLTCLRRFAAIHGSERAATIAAKAFLTLIPLVIVLGGLVSDASRDALADDLAARLRLSAAGEQAMRDLLSTPEGVPAGFTVPGVLLLLFSGVSFVRALQRAWEAAWDLPPTGLRGRGWAMLATCVLLVNLALVNLVATVIRGLPASWLLLLPVRFVLAVGFWLVLQHLLLSRRVPWRDLRAGAVTSAAGQIGATIASAVYVPPLVDSYAGRYGLIGVTFVIVSWFVVLGLILVAGAVLSAELHRRQRRQAGAAADPHLPVPPPD